MNFATETGDARKHEGSQVLSHVVKREAFVFVNPATWVEEHHAADQVGRDAFEQEQVKGNKNMETTS